MFIRSQAAAQATQQQQVFQKRILPWEEAFAQLEAAAADYSLAQLAARPRQSLVVVASFLDSMYSYFIQFLLFLLLFFFWQNTHHITRWRSWPRQSFVVVASFLDSLYSYFFIICIIALPFPASAFISNNTRISLS